MRIDAVPSIVQMEPAVLNNLLKEVKETLATDVRLPGTRSRKFTSADLWNIRRQAKTAYSRISR